MNESQARRIGSTYAILLNPHYHGSFPPNGHSDSEPRAPIARHSLDFCEASGPREIARPAGSVTYRLVAVGLEPTTLGL